MESFHTPQYHLPPFPRHIKTLDYLAEDHKRRGITQPSRKVNIYKGCIYCVCTVWACLCVLVFGCVYVYVDCKPKLKTMCFCDVAWNAACTHQQEASEVQCSSQTSDPHKGSIRASPLRSSVCLCTLLMFPWANKVAWLNLPPRRWAHMNLHQEQPTLRTVIKTVTYEGLLQIAIYIGVSRRPEHVGTVNL